MCTYEEIDLITEGITTVRSPSIFTRGAGWRNWPDYRRDYDLRFCGRVNPAPLEEIDLITEGITTVFTPIAV